MKLDADLARAIMFEIEKTPANRTPSDVVIEGHSEDEVLEHEGLLIDAGFLEGHIHGSGMGGQRYYAVIINGITWEGHEFIAAARSDTLWAKAKEKAVSSGIAISLSLMKPLLLKLAKEKLGIPDSE